MQSCVKEEMGQRAWSSSGKEWEGIGRIRSVQRYKQGPQRSMTQGDGEKKRARRLWKRRRAYQQKRQCDKNERNSLQLVFPLLCT